MMDYSPSHRARHQDTEDLMAQNKSIALAPPSNKDPTLASQFHLHVWSTCVSCLRYHLHLSVQLSSKDNSSESVRAEAQWAPNQSQALSTMEGKHFHLHLDFQAPKSEDPSAPTEACQLNQQFPLNSIGCNHSSENILMGSCQSQYDPQSEIDTLSGSGFSGCS